MAMVSPRLQHDIDRRVRAAYSLDQDRGLCGDTHRSTSVPAALRHHRREEPSRAVTAPAGYRGRHGSTARARLIFHAKHVRTARSGSLPPMTMQCGQEERTGEQSPAISEPRAPTAASVLDAESPLSSEDSLSGTGAGDESMEGSPVLTADVPEKARSRETEGAVRSDSGAPKLMELMEERDRAVHLCLQYRCKLKNTEGNLRAEERLASDLKSQLREANAAGEATRKLFDQVMDKVRADEARKLRQGTGTRQDGRKKAHVAEEARKTRLQLVRARKDLRELWLERDELAMLAGEAIQGQQAGCKRVKKLEIAIAGLREQVAALAASERKAAETTARAEARAMAAEAAESELRKAVEAIKHDFEALVRDLRLREKTIRQLEAKNATLAVRSVTSATAPHDRIRSRQSSADAGKSAEDHRSAAPPVRRVSHQDQGQDELGVKKRVILLESRDSSVDGDGPPAGALDAHENGKGACGVPAPDTHPASLGQSGTSANAPSTPTASVARPARKQLTPQACEIPGRLNTISYPRGGSRATFTPMAAPKTVPVMGKAGDSLTWLREADVKGDDEMKEEEVAGPVLAEAAGKVSSDLNRSARRDESEDKWLGTSTWTCEEQPRRQQQQQQPSQQTTALDHSSPSCQGAPHPLGPLALSEQALPKGHPTSSTLGMPAANVNLGTAVEGAEDVGGGGRAGDGVVQTDARGSTECRESSDGFVDGGRDASAPAPARSPAKPGNNAESDGTKPLPTDGGVEGAEHGVRLGLEVDVESPMPPTLDDVGAGSETPVFRSRLVDGVPVLKYGGGRGKKPKPKVLWVTPDLSEIFYTQTGRTKNSKKTSHMPLAGLCASRGRRDCPDLLRAPTDDRCFALVQADCLASQTQTDGEQHTDRNNCNERDEEKGGGGGSPAPGRRKWGIGGTLPANAVHGKRWRGGAEAGVGAATTGRLTAASSPGRGRARAAAAAATTTTTTTRERMGLETTSAEECTALVDEINDLVRRAGMKHGGGGSSSRGRDLFDEWVRSAAVRRDADADAETAERTCTAEAKRGAPGDTLTPAKVSAMSTD